MKLFTTHYGNIKARYSNTCHTLSRYNCYDTPAKLQKAEVVSGWDSVNKHVYYKAPECVKKIMGGSAGFTIFKSLFVLMALFAYML
jgi:hypothetical protein